MAAPVRAARLNFLAPGPILRVIRPSAPSSFFAALIPLRKGVAVGHLESNAPLSLITPEFSFHREVGALSADGRALALAAQVGNHTELMVLDSRHGNVLQTIPLEPGKRVASLHFAGADKLVAGVAGNHTRAEPVISTWNVVTGEQVSLISLPAPIPDKYNPQNYNVERLAVSPGGKFVACVFRHKVTLFDLAKGEQAGELFGANQANNTDVAFAFSPDGRELAIMGGEQVPGCQLWRFDLSSGKSIAQTTVRLGDFRQVGSNPPQHVAYIPSLNSVLLNGQFVVDFTSGQVIHTLDSFLAKPPSVVHDQLVGVTDGDQLRVVSVGLPVEKLTARRETFQRGGTLEDSMLGDAKQGTLAGVRRLEMPTRDFFWNLAASEPPPRVSGPQTIQLPRVFPEGRSSARGSYGLPVHSALGRHIAWLPYEVRTASRLFSVDAASGKAIGGLEMRPETRAFDISHDGSLIIVGSSKARYLHAEESMERLELYFLPQKKLLFSWRVQSPHASPADQPDPSRFTDAWFITKSQVLTRMEGGSLVLWKLPEVQAQWVLAGEKISVVDFSPDRQWVQLNLGARRLHAWLDVASGEWKGVLPIENEIDTSLELTRDQRRYARLSPNSRTNIWQLTLGNLPGGEVTAQFDVPFSGRIRWLDDRYLLSEPTVIIDSQTGQPICKVEGLGNLSRAADGTYWLFVDSKTNPRLTRTPFPRPALLAKLRTLPPASIQPVLGPGSRVALGAGFKTDHQAMAQHQIAFEKRGWIMDQAAPLRLNFSSQQDAGQTVTYRRGTSGKTETVTVPGPYKTQSSITDSSGKILWKAEGSYLGSAAPPVVVLQGQETLQDQVTPLAEAPEARVDNFPQLLFGTDWYPKLPQVSYTD
jgi:hypothetical protein